MSTYKEPTLEALKDQIRDAAASYSDDIKIQAAMLSGMSLAATFLAKLDGSKVITASNLYSTIIAVGQEMGFTVAKINHER